MKTKTLRRLVSVLAALVMAVSLLAGCGTKNAEQVQEQESYLECFIYAGVGCLFPRSKHILLWK